MNKLTDRQRQVVIEMAENDMNVAAVGRALYIDTSTVKGHVLNITVKTGLSPKCFYDLVELLELVRKGEL